MRILNRILLASILAFLFIGQAQALPITNKYTTCENAPSLSVQALGFQPILELRTQMNCQDTPIYASVSSLMLLTVFGLTVISANTYFRSIKRQWRYTQGQMRRMKTT